MDRNDFITKYWSQYLILEEDFIKTTRYVELDEDNFRVYSVEFIKQLQSICSEVEMLFKELSNLTETEDRVNIGNYAEFILSENNDMSDIVNKNISLKGKKINLTPFKNWDKGKASQSLNWWEEYNLVKHNRIMNYKKANLENILNSLSGLYLLEMYLLKKVCSESGDDHDIPDRASDLFSIEGWKTKSINMDDVLLVNVDDSINN